MDILIARVCRGMWEHSGLGSWLVSAYAHAANNPRIDRIMDVVADQCPTDCARNSCLQMARDGRFDVLFMVDHDNVPHPDWFPFAVDFMAEHPFAVLAAPYCCAPPTRAVQVIVKELGQQRRVASDEAAWLTGVQPAYGVGAVLAIGLPCLSLIKPPWFAYHYKDELHTEAATEDFVFSQKLADAGGEVYVSWDHWAWHAKIEMIGKPGADILVSPDLLGGLIAAAKQEEDGFVYCNWCHCQLASPNPEPHQKCCPVLAAEQLIELNGSRVARERTA